MESGIARTHPARMLTTDPHRILQVMPTAEPEVIQAAYRALASKYHPDRDGSSYAARRMREINEAYAQLRAPAARPRSLSERVIPKEKSSQLSFGRYAGWSLGDLARKDPDYLRWLSRTASGIGYRTEIYQILGQMTSNAA